jgi:hypothetical protein
VTGLRKAGNIIGKSFLNDCNSMLTFQYHGYTDFFKKKWPDSKLQYVLSFKRHFAQMNKPFLEQKNIALEKAPGRNTNQQGQYVY